MILPISRRLLLKGLATGIGIWTSRTLPSIADPPPFLLHRNENVIHFSGDITDESCFYLNIALNEAHEIGNPVLYMTSNGGAVMPALYVSDNISSMHATSIVSGYAASAATLITCACDNKYIFPNSQMLVHQLSAIAMGHLREIEAEVETTRKMDETIRNVYLKHTKMTSNILDDLFANHDRWLDAQQCIEYGLVDDVVE
jgi:ATP-dependent protease ClpP protease subunit